MERVETYRKTIYYEPKMTGAPITQWNRRLMCWVLLSVFCACCVAALILKPDPALVGIILGALGGNVTTVLSFYFVNKSSENKMLIDAAKGD